MAEVKPFAFVLMPFDKAFDDIYQLGIKQACNDLDIVAERVDEQIFSETILERIYRQIENADFIIADMTGRNPNVFYEVGYAHAKGKLCALITQNKEDIPFDLQHHFHLIYDGKILDLKSKLVPRLEWMIGELKKSKTMIFDVNIKKSNINLEVTEYSHIGSFDLKITLKNIANSRSPEIDTVSILTSNKWKVSSNKRKCANEPAENGTKRFFVEPTNKRIAASALSQLEVTFDRTFWTKWGGEEKKESYRSKGQLAIEVSTAEGKFPYMFELDMEFDENPF